MTTPGFISKHLVENVVYWRKTGSDGYGKDSFAAPVDLDARVETAKEMLVDKEGEITSWVGRAWFTQEVTEGSYIYAGYSTDSNIDSDPKNIDGAYRIISPVKVPRLGSTTEFVYKAHLNKILAKGSI